MTARTHFPLPPDLPRPFTRSKRLGAATVALSLVAALGDSAAQSASAEDFVKAFFATFYPPGDGGIGGPSIWHAQYARRYFVPSLAAAMLDRTRRENIDVDPVTGDQDLDITAPTLKTAAQDGRGATVLASFRNFGKPHTTAFMLARDGERWRIRDICPTHDGRVTSKSDCLTAQLQVKPGR